SKDGALEGPATALYSQIVKEFPSLHFIASGGVSSLDDVYRLQEAGCRGVIIGKAIYEGRVTLKELAKLDR
ncbi:MAG: HisA/HisF-related TIM barrel protein, partial [Flavisolibacter sp.]